MQQFHRHFVADVQAFCAKHATHATLTEALDQFVLGIEDEADAGILVGRVLSVCRSRRISIRFVLPIDLRCGVAWVA
jgi:hypothetical protein